MSWLTKLPGRCLSRILQVLVWPIWPPFMSDYISTWWKLVSGRYGVEMRGKLEKQLALIPRPQPVKSLRIFHGLYHTPQPVFLSEAFKARGHTSIYETIDFNPAFPKVDAYHKMYHPDFYREHAVIDKDTLIRINPPVTNAANLAQLEQFYFERWPKYDIFQFNWFITFLPDNLDVEFLRRSGRQVYFHFHGCWVLEKIIPQFTCRGESVVDACRYCKKKGWRKAYFSWFYRGVSHASRVFTSSPNLCHCSPDFEYLPNSLEQSLEMLPAPVPRKHSPGKPVIVAHSRENAPEKKGTTHVIKAIETLKAEGLKVELNLIHGVSRDEAIRQYGQSDIFLEQLHAGSYGSAALEAMAQGVPVISSHHPSHAHLAPGCPVVHADPLTVTDRLRELVVNPELRDNLGRKGFEWRKIFHSTEKIADHLLGLYREDLGMKASSPRNTLGNLNPSYG